MQRKIRTLRGDTLVEVMFAVGIFGIIAVSAISLMNRGLNTAQQALETTMARNEIDAQAEALRFIHDAYASEKKVSNKEYEDLWKDITDLALEANQIHDGGTYPRFLANYPNGIISCVIDNVATEGPLHSAYNSGIGIITGKSFIINTHKLDSHSALNNRNEIVYTFSNDDDINGKIHSAITYPRLIFDEGSDHNLGSSAYHTSLSAAQGIWVTAVKSSVGLPSKPQYYDFYIRTCWNSPGRTQPTTISTTIRLYNPDY